MIHNDITPGNTTVLVTIDGVLPVHDKPVAAGSVEMNHYGRAHTNGDIVILLLQDRVLAVGDMFFFGDATPQLIDYSAAAARRSGRPPSMRL
jgi:glyoxylase-like metal-dependent hydrolase (beta-lactamase superfamily II)